MEHIVRYEDMYFVTIPRDITKTNKDNAFGITSELFHIVKKYEAMSKPIVFSSTFKKENALCKSLENPSSMECLVVSPSF